MALSTTKPTAEQYAQASHWVSLLHDGDCTLEQRREFHAWLSLSPRHQQAYSEVETFWQQTGDLGALAKPQIEAARSYTKRKPANHRWLPRFSLALAASFLIIVLAFPLFRLVFDNGTYHTAKGERQTLNLGDGSRIDLNTDTKIIVSYTLFDRKVKLEQGEALFTVKHDADKPFAVEAAYGIVRDIGTQFNVYKQGEKVAVTVLEGEVSINNRHGGTPQNLTAGMQLAYGDNGLKPLVQKGDFTDIAAWREGKIVFKGQRLDVVLQQLSRYHDIKLSIGNSNLSVLKVSGSFPTGDLHVALNTIVASLPVKITRLGADRIALGASGKLK